MPFFYLTISEAERKGRQGRDVTEYNVKMPLIFPPILTIIPVYSVMDPGCWP